MENVIDIHPFDLGDILNKMDYPELTILTSKSKWHEEIVEVEGKTYRQTVDVPVKSDYGKELLKKM